MKNPTRVTVRARAKINLDLRILGRRADGYHELRTIFQALTWHDTVTVSRVQGPILITGDASKMPLDHSNLAWRAADALWRAAGSRREPAGARIAIVKRIPAQAGLGGGSSDAATTLVALNEIWGLRLAPSLLAELGLELGADIPFFILGQTAWGEGVGERLTPLELPEAHFAVVFPGVGIRTADVFQAPELTRKTPETTIRGFLKAGGHNDCEPVVTGRSPEVRRALAWLAERGRAQMTGTGSCVFASFADRKAALAALEGLPPGWRGFVARGLDRSPLQERLAAERSRGSGRI